MTKSVEQLERELYELRLKLDEANETIEAIRTGQVDALIVQNEDGHQLYTLKNADQTYRVFIEKMNEGAVTLNREGIIVYSNSSFANALEIPLEKVIGLSFIDFMAPESREGFKSLLECSWENDCKAELYLLNSSGEPIPFLLSLNTLELDEGTSMSVILTDLTSQKKSQKLLKIKNEELEEAQQISVALNNQLEDTVKKRTNELFLSREHFKMLSNNISQMTWTNLPNGEVNFFNERWYEYTGLTLEQSNDWAAVVHPDDLERTLSRFSTALKTGGTFEIENRYKRYDGNYRWHLNRANPLRSETGEILFWVGTATDIEDQKRAMEKKDEFIGIASHELKTPLTSLKGYLQLIGSYKNEPVPPRVKQFVGKADEAIGKLQNLVNDLLDVSKIQKGKLQFSKSTLNITNVINSCVESATHIYPTYNISGQVEDGLFVKGNFERLEQVLMNFISNSVKYSPVNKDIVVKAERHSDFVQISVSDDGIGLTDSQMKRIFERFYRVDDKNFSASGLGMGLYISSEIIKAHNGTIGVNSKFNEGSTFYFRLPVLNP
ncbi:ATP-binding protein [Paradesertivirga mongoliensis]|uniref:histidine kinase n=1 Tax=Paradesertivirga mongoliensis TaxID=2100740 RepID=A0ABW4ZLP9_9SPHI|nr:ATP-binding protein [Pedobacter mongoliensis]